MIPFLLVFLFVGLMTFLVVWVLRYGGKKNAEKNARFKEFGLSHKLTYSEKPYMFVKLPFLTGKIGDHTVDIYEKVVGSGKHQSYYTEINFSNSPHNFQFRIGKEHFFSKVGKKIGFKDIEFDHYELDKQFLFKSDNEGLFRALMNYKVLHDLEGLIPKFKGAIQHQNGMLNYSQLGVLSKPEQFEDLELILTFMTKLIQKSAY